MIKIIIDGEEYTEEQYKKDLIRLFDYVRKKDSENRGELNCDDVYCCDCPLKNVCFYSGWGPTYISYDYIDAVYKWSKKHPIKTNKDKIKEVFGIDELEFLCNTNEENKMNWLNKEYEEPKGENKND